MVEFVGDGLAYDDVLIVPKRSKVRARKEISLKTKLTNNISLNIPIVSSNMDTVTESKMAIAMAKAGGIGFIHRFLTIHEQVREVIKVKRFENIVVENPYTLPRFITVEEAKEFLKERNISSILVADSNNYIEGIVTNRDFMFAQKMQKLGDIMTPKSRLITSYFGISIEEAKKILYENRLEKLPLINSEGIIKGLITSKDILETQKFPYACKDEKGRLRVGAAIGVRENDIERAKELIRAGADVIVVDIAHGHSDLAINMVQKLKKEFLEIEVVAGNVATPEGVEDLINAGADCVKVGVGPGAMCFEGSTPILMSNHTVKDIKDIKVGDFVITHKGRAKKVINTYKRKHEGKLFKINIRGCPGKLLITSEHPLLACVFGADYNKIKKYGSKYYFDQNKKVSWTEAGKLSVGDVLLIPKEKLNFSNKTFDLLEIMSDYNADSEKIWSSKIGFNPNPESYVSVAQKFNTTPRIIGNIVHGGRSVNIGLNLQVNEYLDMQNYAREIEPIKLNRHIELDENLMRLLGYYVAEGYISGPENNKHLAFAFSDKEHEYHNDVSSLIFKIFDYDKTSIVKRQKKNSANVIIYNHIISNFFKEIFPGRWSGVKEVPEFVFNQNRTLLKNFLIGAIRGDGSIKDFRRVAYTTVSRTLAFQIAKIFELLGYMPSIKVSQPKNKNWNAQWRVTISGKQFNEFVKDFSELKIKKSDVKGKQQFWQDDDYIYASIESIKSFDGEIDVYNFEVEDDNSYIANRVTVHNCTTRIVTGSGYPQLSALIECAKIAKKYDIPLNADGGIRSSGDIAKAIAAGANTVMIGSMLSGTDESPGEFIVKNGIKYKIYRGMASLNAAADRRKIDSKEKININDIVPEGVETMVPYKGSAQDLIKQLVGGLLSGISYGGADNIEEFQEKAEFVKITDAGMKESKPHGERG